MEENPMKSYWLIAVLGLPGILVGCATAPKVSKLPQTMPNKMETQMPDFSTLGRATLTEKGLKLTLSGDDLFDIGHSYLSRKGIQKIDVLAAVLLKYPGDSVLVKVYTDSTGTDAKNLKISQRRADHIQKELVKQGVSVDQITIIGKGDVEPIAGNDTNEGRAQNRRAEFDIASVQ
jgi:outer membrane protein OmpA-like peptidoglycan-associated protein